MPQARIGKIGQKNPDPVTAQMPTMNAFTITKANTFAKRSCFFRSCFRACSRSSSSVCTMIITSRLKTRSPRSSGRGTFGPLRSGPLADLPGLPDLLARPPLRPLDRDVRLALLRTFRRLDLDEILDLEPRRTQQPDHVAVPEMELDGVHGVPGLMPLEAVHAEVRPVQRRLGGSVVVV